MKNTDFKTKIAELQKLAMDLENGDVSPKDTSGTPEEVMEIVEEVIDVLEEAKDLIPAESGGEEDGEMPNVESLMAKVYSHIAKDDDETKKDEDDKEKEAKTKIAETQGEQQENEDDDDEKEESQSARIANLEAELEARKRQAISQDAGELFPDTMREAEVEKLAKSKGSLKFMEAKIKFAKHVLELQVPKTARLYQAPTHGSGFIKKAKKQQVQTVPEWRY